jgi:CheY-like chemotaxis protein
MAAPGSREGASDSPADSKPQTAPADAHVANDPHPATSESFTPATTGDAPTSEDELGFKPYARALGEFLLNPETQGPLTVSIEGEWGSGKSSFMLMLEHHLRTASAVKQKLKIRHNVPVVAKFNPWRHDRDEALWAAFAMGLTTEIVKDQDFLSRLKGHIRLFASRFEWKHGWVELLKVVTTFLFATGLLLSILALTAENGPAWLAKFAKNVTISSGESTSGKDKDEGQPLPPSPTQTQTPAGPAAQAGKNSVSPSVTGTEWFTWLSGFGFFGVLSAYLIAVLSIGSKLKILFSTPLAASLSKHMKSPDYASRVSFIEEFHQDFKRVVQAHAMDKTIFVFIDDLDRCSVPKAAELMQAINLMISTELTNIVFILGMDRAKIAAGLAARNAELLPYLYPDAVGLSDSKSLPTQVGLQFGFEYIEKFIQVVFPLPKPRTADVDRFLNALASAKATAPDLRAKDGSAVANFDTVPATMGKPALQPDAEPATASSEFQVEFSTDSQNVRQVAREVSRFFQDNPRRLKQFINVFRLRAFIAYETGVLRPGRLTPQQLGKLVALQMRWPIWTGACLRNPERLQALRGENPLDLAGSDLELKALLGLGRRGSLPSRAWDLEGADLEGFIRVSPVIRTVDLNRVPETKPLSSFAQEASAPAVRDSSEFTSQIVGDGNVDLKPSSIAEGAVDEVPARILWVDNRPSNNTELQTHIEDSFHVEFSLCTSTDEALQRAATERFALIISDMGRSGDSHAGYTLLSKLRENGSDTPFLIYSSRGGAADKAEARKRGAVDFTDQPQDVVTFVSTIARPKRQEKAAYS